MNQEDVHTILESPINTDNEGIIRKSPTQTQQNDENIKLSFTSDDISQKVIDRSNIKVETETNSELESENGNAQLQGCHDKNDKGDQDSELKVEESQGLLKYDIDMSSKYQNHELENDIKYEDLLIPQSHEIVIPSYSKWFHLNKIHELEKKSLPEFFTNRIPSKTPHVYVKYRNFMVNSYRLNPNEYFTMTAARRNLCGDAGSIFRLHKFLSKWGLINYQVDSKLNPSAIEPPYTGDYATKHDAPRGLFPFQSYKPVVQIPDMTSLKKMMTQLNDPAPIPSVNSNSKHTDEEYGDEISSTMHPPKKVKIPDLIDKGWEKEELINLLKSLQKNGTDWLSIARDVKTKTPEQCILRFLQLPIEDTFLENESQLGPLKFGSHLPFSKANNPVMSTIAFLTGLIDPKIVQSMTNRAIQFIKDERMKSVDHNTNSNDNNNHNNDSLNNDNHTSIDMVNSKSIDENSTKADYSNDADDIITPSHKSMNDTPKSVLKEASELAIASLGVRSHIFATNEERQMNLITNELIHAQINKLDLKLKLLDTMEKSLEIERKSLQKQQEDLFIQRLSLSRYCVDITNKFEKCLNEIANKTNLKAYVGEIKDLIDNPPKVSISKRSVHSSPAETSKSETPAITDQSNSENPDEVNLIPISMDSPQLYRYWSG